jgi:BMFP domain-containing protein YqiC
MKQNHFMFELFESLEPILETLSPSVSQEIKDAIKSTFKIGLRNFEFVDFEELRVQKKVLQKTRLKVEALEKQLDELLKES